MSVPAEGETRIIAIGNPHVTVRDMFHGVMINPKGDIHVGETTLHPQELGPVLANTVSILNDYIESHADHELSPNRVIIFFPEGYKAKRPPKYLETIGTWVYSEDNLDIRIQLLEAVVNHMRQNPELA